MKTPRIVPIIAAIAMTAPGCIEVDGELDHTVKLELDDLACLIKTVIDDATTDGHTEETDVNGRDGGIRDEVEIRRDTRDPDSSETENDTM